MLRRLLTCFALLTGLAATGAPAHAYAVEAMATEVERTGKTAESDQDVHCEQQKTRELQRKHRRIVRCEPMPTVTIFVPTVLIGIDRSYE